MDVANQFKCDICITDLPIYYCSHPHSQCPTRLLCTRCILQHDATHSTHTLLLSDLIGSCPKHLMTFESIVTEADKVKEEIVEGAMMLKNRLQYLIDEIMKAIGDALNREKEAIMDKFWKEYDENVVKKHREIEEAVKKYKDGVDLVGVSMMRDEIEKTVQELSKMAEMWSLSTAEQSRKMHLESMKQFSSKWRLEAFSKDLLMIEIDSLNLKISSEMKKVVWSNASVEFSTIFNTYPGVSRLSGSLAGDLFVGESKDANNTSIMDTSISTVTGVINPVKPQFLSVSVIDDLPKEPSEVKRSRSGHKRIFEKDTPKEDLKMPPPLPMNDPISTTWIAPTMVSQSAPLGHIVGLYPSLNTVSGTPGINLYAPPEMHQRESRFGLFYSLQPPIIQTQAPWVADFYHNPTIN